MLGLVNRFHKSISLQLVCRDRLLLLPRRDMHAFLGVVAVGEHYTHSVGPSISGSHLVKS